MPKLLVRCALVVLAVSFAACSSGKEKKPKSSSHMYEGDSPSIHYNYERETAGGLFKSS